jgi:DNA polymerase-3 subunit gamma/tau
MTEERVELHLKYRPQTFDEIIGNREIKESIVAGISRSRTFLFYGPRGCGKTTIARLIAKEIGAAEIDTHEIDAADKTGVDDARAIKEASQFSPMGGKFKIYIIDECHRLSGNASDSLLKTLENPPDHCYFVLCTTELQKVSTTIKSRAKRFEVKPLTEAEQNSLIKLVCHREGIRLSPAVRKAIIDSCEGIPREIIIAIDTIRDTKSDDDALSLINSLVHREVIDLCRALIKRENWKIVSGILKDLQAKEDHERTRMAVLGYMNTVLLNATDTGSCNTAALIIEEFKGSVMYSGKAGLTYACYMAVK